MLTTITLKRQGGQGARFSSQLLAAQARLNLAVAEGAAETARQLVPVQTGALRGNIAAIPLPASGSALLVAGTDEITYAAYVEFGTRNNAAQPYFIPAVLSTGRKVAGIARGLRLFR